MIKQHYFIKKRSDKMISPILENNKQYYNFDLFLFNTIRVFNKFGDDIGLLSSFSKKDQRKLILRAKKNEIKLKVE